MMQTKQLCSSNLKLTVIGLGAWAIGGPWQFGWGPQDDNDSIKTILEALDNGINWIDTAPIYGCGHSEEIVAKALKQTSAKPFIATKCGLLWNDKKEKINCLKKDSIRKECSDSLKRLGIDTIDLYQMHWPEPDEDVEEAWEEMVKLKKEGKVGYIGVSNFNVEQIRRIIKIQPPSSLQISYSMLQRQPEEELLGYCAKNNISVFAYSPIARGLLTGKFTKQYLRSLAPDDHRLRTPDFQEPNFSATVDLIEQLRPIAKSYNMTVSQLAISWVLHRKEITAAIVGARKPQQIAETVKGADLRLKKEDIEKIEKLLAERQKKISQN